MLSEAVWFLLGALAGAFVSVLAVSLCVMSARSEDDAGNSD